MFENSTNPSDATKNHDVTLYLEQMLARDKALSEKIASMIDLDKVLKPNPKISEFIDKLFERNEAAEKWTEYLQKALYGKLSHHIDGTPIDDEYEELEPSDIVTDAIEDRVTEINEPVAQKHHLRITADGFLIDQDDPNKTHLLSPQMQRLLASLKKTYQKTRALRDRSEYKNDAVFYQSVHRLNEIGFGIFKLTTKIAIGERTLGFRLAKHLIINFDKRNPNIQLFL